MPFIKTRFGLTLKHCETTRALPTRPESAPACTQHGRHSESGHMGSRTLGGPLSETDTLEQSEI